MSEKKLIVVPNEDEFKPAPIPFGVVTGDGVDNYNRDGKEYSVSIVLTEEMAEFFKEQLEDYWSENAPKGAEDEPDNIDSIVREGKGDYEGKYILYAKTKTNFGEGKPNVIPIVNQEATKLDSAEHGLIGKGSKGRLAVTLSTYSRGRDHGVSVFLSAIKLTKYVKLETGGAAAFGIEDGEVEGESNGFTSESKSSPEPKPKKKKKKKKEKSVK